MVNLETPGTGQGDEGAEPKVNTEVEPVGFDADPEVTKFDRKLKRRAAFENSAAEDVVKDESSIVEDVPEVAVEAPTTSEEQSEVIVAAPKGPNARVAKFNKKFGNTQTRPISGAGAKNIAKSSPKLAKIEAGGGAGMFGDAYTQMRESALAANGLGPEIEKPATTEDSLQTAVEQIVNQVLPAEIADSAPAVAEENIPTTPEISTTVTEPVLEQAAVIEEAPTVETLPETESTSATEAKADQIVETTPEVIETPSANVGEQSTLGQTEEVGGGDMPDEKIETPSIKEPVAAAKPATPKEVTFGPSKNPDNDTMRVIKEAANTTNPFENTPDEQAEIAAAAADMAREKEAAISKIVTNNEKIIADAKAIGTSGIFTKAADAARGELIAEKKAKEKTKKPQKTAKAEVKQDSWAEPQISKAQLEKGTVGQFSSVDFENMPPVTEVKEKKAAPKAKAAVNPADFAKGPDSEDIAKFSKKEAAPMKAAATRMQNKAEKQGFTPKQGGMAGEASSSDFLEKPAATVAETKTESTPKLRNSIKQKTNEAVEDMIDKSKTAHLVQKELGRGTGKKNKPEDTLSREERAARFDAENRAKRQAEVAERKLKKAERENAELDAELIDQSAENIVLKQELKHTKQELVAEKKQNAFLVRMLQKISRPVKEQFKKFGNFMQSVFSTMEEPKIVSNSSESSTVTPPKMPERVDMKSLEQSRPPQKAEIYIASLHNKKLVERNHSRREIAESARVYADFLDTEIRKKSDMVRVLEANLKPAETNIPLWRRNKLGFGKNFRYSKGGPGTETYHVMSQIDIVKKDMADYLSAYHKADKAAQFAEGLDAKANSKKNLTQLNHYIKYGKQGQKK